MDVQVGLVVDVDSSMVEGVARLIPQVSSRTETVSAERVRSIARGPDSCLVVARIGDRVVGSATLLTLRTLAGAFGYLEEVVVDESVRGRGVGAKLVSEVLAVAKSRDLEFIELTSRPARKAANRLYGSLGFSRRDTNVYRYTLATSEPGKHH